MGAGIAYVSAQAGLEVVLIDRDQEAADKGKAYSQKLMDGQIKRGRAKQADADALLARITPTPDYDELEGVDLVIEAVFEDRKVKAEATAKAQAVIGDKVVFGSNTSTLPITSLADDSKDPKNFIGMHFFSPVDKMMLVEIIMGEKTADPALAVALDYVRAIRKTPIVVNDSRGFYTSRVVGTYIREGHLMLTEGVPAAMIENVGKHGRHAGRPALAQRRGRGRPRLEDPEGDRSRSRRGGDRRAAEGAARRDGREARPLRAQERQGLLRLSAERAEAAVAGPRRIAADEARSRHDRQGRAEGSACLRSRRSRPRAASRRSVLTDVREADVGSILGFGYAPYSGGTLSYIDMMGAKKFVALCERWRRNTASALSRTSCSSRWRRKARASIRASPRSGRRQRRSSHRGLGATLSP